MPHSFFPCKQSTMSSRVGPTRIHTITPPGRKHLLSPPEKVKSNDYWDPLPFHQPITSKNCYHTEWCLLLCTYSSTNHVRVLLQHGMVIDTVHLLHLSNQGPRSLLTKASQKGMNTIRNAYGLPPTLFIPGRPSGNIILRAARTRGDTWRDRIKSYL